MSVKDRQRAERCFALAASTTFDGERSAAIARGMAICEKAGLDLDEFDIPGRQRAKPRAADPYARYRERGNASARPSTFWDVSGGATADDVAATMARFAEIMRAQRAEAYHRARAAMGNARREAENMTDMGTAAR